MAISLSISTQPNYSSTSSAYFGRNLYFTLSGLISGRTYKLTRYSIYPIWEETWTGEETETKITYAVPVSQMPSNSASETMNFWLQEYDESGKLTDTVIESFTLTVPTSYVPTVSIEVCDTAGHAETYGAYLQAVSRVGVTITAAGVAGSTIKTYSTTIQDGVYTTANVESNALRYSGECTVTVTVKDSRGRKATATAEITVLPYSLPTITALKSRRTDADGNSISTGEYLTVSFNAEVYSLNDINTPLYTLVYNKKGADEYTELILSEYSGVYSVSGASVTFPADTNELWEIALTVTDGLSTVTRNTTGAAVGKLFSVLHRGLGFAFGKMATLEGVFEIGFKSQFSGGILPVELSSGTDLDSVMIPTDYSGDLDNAEYGNCSISSGKFRLSVKEIGTGGGFVQELVTMGNCRYIRYRRMYDGVAWNAWRQAENVITLPSGYKAVEYIESSGTQYIDTGFMPNQDTRVVMDAHCSDGTAGNNTALFHSRDSSNENGFGLFILNSIFRCDYKSSKIRLATTVTTDARYIFDFNKNVHTIGETVTKHTASTFSSPANLVLFAANTGGSISYKATMKLYSCKIYDNGTLIRDFVPCKTDSGTYGLFECLSGAFYANEGTGAFTGA